MAGLGGWFRRRRRERPPEPEPAPLTPLSFKGQVPVDREQAPRPEAKDGAALVESGSFRVDAAHAAELLGRFQLADAEHFLVPWLRCAVASGSRRIIVTPQYGKITVTFDGRGLPAEVMADPVGGLLGAINDEAARQLAIGLLALLRLSPTSVDITSGIGGRRRRVRAPAEPGHDDGLMPEGTETVLEVRWKTDSGQTERAIANVSAAYGMCQSELVVSNWTIPDPARARAALVSWRGKESGSGIVLERTKFGQFQESRVRFYKLGAFVEETSFDWVPPGQVCFIADDAFKLDLSQGKIVKNERYTAAVERYKGLQSRIDAELKANPRLRQRLAAWYGDAKQLFIVFGLLVLLAVFAFRVLFH